MAVQLLLLTKLPHDSGHCWAHAVSPGGPKAGDQDLVLPTIEGQDLVLPKEVKALAWCFCSLPEPKPELEPSHGY